MKNDDKKKLEIEHATIYQTMDNCQVFNGPISGSVFAMPGSTVNHTATQQVMAPQAEKPAPEPSAAPRPSEELFYYIHPQVADEKAKWDIHFKVKSIVMTKRLKDICDYLMKMEKEKKIILPHQNPKKLYNELVRLGMPTGKGFSESTFRNHFM